MCAIQCGLHYKLSVLAFYTLAHTQSATLCVLLTDYENALPSKRQSDSVE